VGYSLSTNTSKLRSLEQKTRMPISFERHYETNKKLFEHIDCAAWANSPCVIIGGGESLRGISNNHIPLKYKRIGVNRAFEKYTCDLIYTMDLTFIKMIDRCALDQHTGKPIRKQFMALDTKVALLAPDDSCDRVDLSKCYLIRRIPEMTISEDLKVGIWGGNNSGLGAMMLAVALHCNPIYLLGIDLKITKYTHWHNGYPQQTVDRLNEKHVGFKKVFEQVAPLLKSKGIRIYNCSDDSSLTCFDVGAL